MKLARVIFDIPIERSFYYLCEDSIVPFIRVLAPLGKRRRKGFIIELKEISEKNLEYKWIEKIYDFYPLINEEIFEISKIVSRRYYSSLGQVIFSIIGNFPLRYEKKELKKKKIDSIFPSNNFKKEIYLFNSKKEKLNFYIDLISNTDGSTIFLFPEISILEEYFLEIKERIDRRFLKYYGEMRKKAKFMNYLESMNGENLIIFGTRTAVFLPVPDLNRIVIDSPFDFSYREKKYPKYNAVEVAERRCEYRKIPVIFTSNTLGIKDYYEIKNNRLYLIDKRKFENLPEIFILNKKWEEVDRNIQFLTKFASSLIEENILKGKKVGIIHNRKGSSKTFKCEKCGYILRCKKCDSYLILSDKNTLFCKYCKIYESFKKSCPNCGSKEIIERVVGIEKIYNILKNVYPEFKIQKLTAEEREVKEDIDIFVGTKIISKIMDKFDFGLIIFPHADSFLNIPEYNSEEIFFFIVNEFLWELDKDSKVVIQTKNPNFEIFTSFKNKNFNIFYEKELNIRKLVGYPPFADIMVIEVPLKKSSSFENKVNFLKKNIEKSSAGILFSEIIKDKRGVNKLKMVVKTDIENKPDFEEIMNLKEKLDFKIEINPEVI